MAYWVLKEEPGAYSYFDLERDGATRWSGVHNALALRHLRAMRVGDRAIFYHTGTERACVGILRVTTAPQPDPADARGSSWVEVAPVRRLRRPVPLEEIRLDPALVGLDLVRLPRLSVVPVSPDQWDRLLAHEDASPRAAGAVTAGTTRSRGPAADRAQRPSGARRRR